MLVCNFKKSFVEWTKYKYNQDTVCEAANLYPLRPVARKAHIGPIRICVAAWDDIFNRNLKTDLGFTRNLHPYI